VSASGTTLIHENGRRPISVTPAQEWQRAVAAALATGGPHPALTPVRPLTTELCPEEQ
jgi:hypothetical protein